MPGDKASGTIPQQIVTSNQNTKISGYPPSATTTCSQASTSQDGPQWVRAVEAVSELPLMWAFSPRCLFMSANPGLHPGRRDYSSLRTDSRKARIAGSANGGAQVFTVTHPFHPLRGQTFDLLAVRNNWGGDRVSYVGSEGRLRTLPIEWTDVHKPDLAITLGAGRALFRADMLRQLRRLVDEQVSRREGRSC